MRKILKTLRDANPEMDFKSGLYRTMSDNAPAVFARRRDAPKRYQPRTNSGGWLFYGFLSELEQECK